MATKTKEPDVKVTEQMLAEAPASLNFYGVTQAGWNIQVTLRDVDEYALLDRFGNLVKKLEAWQVTPKAVGRQPEPSSGNGGQKANVPDDDPGWCKIHDCKMYENENDRGKWWSHKTDDPAYKSGFCNGKAK